MNQLKPKNLWKNTWVTFVIPVALVMIVWDWAKMAGQYAVHGFGHANRRLKKDMKLLKDTVIEKYNLDVYKEVEEDTEYDEDQYGV